MANAKQTTESQKPKFPSEIVDLPSKGYFYPEDNPLSQGQVEVKYKYDYGKRKFEETTGEIRVNEHYLQNKYFTTGSYQQKIDGTIATDINYYGLKTENNEIDHINTFLIYESKYIRDYNTALNLAQHLLAWRCNQHNLLEVTLPLSYYYLELGDLVEFDEMILNKKL